MKHVYKPAESFALVLMIFKIFGLWPSAVKNSFLSFVHRICGYGFQLFFVIATLIPQIINIYLTRGSLEKLIDGSFLTLSCIICATKLGIFCRRLKDIEKFFERLHQPIFAPKRKEQLLVLKNCTSIGNAYALLFFILPQLTFFSWILIPLIDNKSGNKLVFASWYPFDTIKSPNYEIMYAFQVILLLNAAIMHPMMNLLILNFYLTMVGQLEILKQDFLLLANFSDEEEDFELEFQDGISHKQKSIKEFFREGFEKCTKHYEAIRSFINDITEVFQMGILFHMGASCFIICLTCLKLTMSSPKTFQFYVVIQYQLCMLVEIFSYTWRGNEIMVKSAELKDAIYECDWTSINDKEFRKSLCFIMSRVQIPIKLRVGKFFPLTASYFITILTSAYSFYVLLKQLQSKKVKGPF
ncbi:odorant receptor 49b-like [Belonocnema kinseyi]|uniref:odorant receptor 49b-like n=1 Tax=Belonocnema kinseyi TaxID=2817044 RepID=UPI00143DF602|nr:odorant receptor 49b-like [Belonocnema kinseyi]